ncbi:hypothetical protein WJX79_000575 [Trebouxia sp. C0005]
MQPAEKSNVLQAARQLEECLEAAEGADVSRFYQIAQPDLVVGRSVEPVKVTSNSLVTYTGDRILVGCFPRAFITEKDADGVVLGFGASEGPVAIQDFSLGKLQCSAFVSSARNKLWWMTPHWGSQARDILPETQFVLMQTREDGPYVVLLPLIDKGTFRATLRPPRMGLDGAHDLRIRIESGDASVKESKWERALYVAAGNDPYALLDAAVAKAAALSGGAKPLSQKQIPKSLDVFGWCTWDAFYFRVSAKGIIDGLRSLKDAGVSPKLLVIDDGWQLTEVDEPYRKAAAAARVAQARAIQTSAVVEGITGGPDEPWEGDHTNTEDLTSVVQHVKRDFGLDFVYCWHALHAYWSGVSPSAVGVQAYGSQITFPIPTPGIMELEPSTLWNPQVVAGIGAVPDPTKLHTDMHTYLADCGVDGVKVDVQGTVGLMGSKLGGGPDMTRKYHQSLERSVQTAFPGNHCINCMCHSTENLYRMESTAVARVSDDFYPTDAASWSSHLGICAYNSLFMAPLVQPDWDMFHSKHPAALLHATARVVSGSGIYVSDKPGRPTKDILFADVLKDNKTLLKVWNKNPVNGLVGVFNVQGSSWSRKKRRFYTHDPSPPVLETLVTPTHVHSFAQPGSTPQHFAMWSDRTQALVLSAHQEDGLTVRLAAGASDVVTVAPIFGVGTAVQVACIGLVNMLNAGGSVLSVKLQERQGNRKGIFCEVLVKGTGSLVLYASAPPADAHGNGAGLRHSYNDHQKKLTVEVPVTSDLQTMVQIRF